MTLPDWIESRIRIAKNGCWIWTGVVGRRGYGSASRIVGARQNGSAHRAVYRTLVGPIPAGLQLDHLCHTNDPSCAGGFGCLHRRCVNPAHLEPVTASENMRRSPMVGGQNRANSHCAHGHERTPPNTYVRRDGRKQCRVCATEAQRRYEQRRAAA